MLRGTCPRSARAPLLRCLTMRRVAPSCLLLAAALGSGCGDLDGAVELAWVIVDRDGDAIFPGGVFSLDDERDSCELRGVVGDRSVSYDLRVELEVCDPSCEAGCDSEQCQVLPRHEFACNEARGSLPTVPDSGGEPYLFTVRAVVSVPSLQLECREPSPSCVAVPAPRERRVEPGLVTDLQVYQIAIDVDRDSNEPLDLEACGCA